MGPRVVDALMFKRVGTSEDSALIRVEGYERIRARQAQGWQVLIHAADVRYADIAEVHELDVRRFASWRSAWEGGA
jgi:hypothetical protein